MTKERFKDICIFGLVACVIALFFLSDCHREPKPVNQIDLKPELIRKDSFRTVIKYHDSTRLTVLKKWRTITNIKDSVKCYTEIMPFIQACDTVILKDSILINALYGQHRNDSIIDLKKDSIIVQKSDSIKTLTRKLKWAKLKTKGVIALWLAREAVGVGVKLIP